VSERLPEQSQQATLGSLGDEKVRALVEAYVDTWRNADVAALLAEDAVFSMPPWRSWWRGRIDGGSLPDSSRRRAHLRGRRADVENRRPAPF
jgi:hypothetical protein